MLRRLFKVASGAIFGATAFANVLLVSSAVNAEETAVTAAELAQQAAFKDSLLKELEEAGIESPAFFDPFPTGNVRAHFGYVWKQPVVIGFSKSEAYFDTTGNFGPSCKNNFFITHFFETQKFVGYHELVHYIDVRLGLTQTLFQRDLPAMNLLRRAWPRDPAILRYSLMENLADAAAILYMRSRGTGMDMANAWIDFRIAGFGSQIFYGRGGYVHHTAETIKAAVKEFSKHPRRNITLVEAAQWARDVIAVQAKDPIFAEGMKIAAASREATDRAKLEKAEIVEPDSENPQQARLLKEYVANAKAAKARFCKGNSTVVKHGADTIQAKRTEPKIQAELRQRTTASTVAVPRR